MYLSPPPGIVASERLFSVGEKDLQTTQLRLKPENMEVNLFLKYNIKALGYRTAFLMEADDWEPPNSCSLPAAVIEQDELKSCHDA